MTAETWASLLAWATIYQWLAIAIVFEYDAIRVHLRTRRLLAMARASETGNGRVVVAEIRTRISVWYIVAATIAVILGCLGVYSNASLTAPPPDTRIIGAVIREGIVVFIFAVWRTKRLNVVLFRLMDARHTAESSLAGDPAKDINS